MGNIKEPKYDTDQVNYGFLKKVLSKSNEEQKEEIKSYSKSFSSPPNPPYYVGWTYSQNNKIYRCIKDRLIGSFSITDWVVIYDQNQEDMISKNFLFLSEIELKEQNDGKIETFYQNDDPSINWDTSLIKSNHEGDYWRANIDGIYKSYVYVKYATNPITYQWEQIDVPISIFNTISGYKTIHTIKPSAYLKDDLWKVREEDIVLFSNLNLSIGNYIQAIQDSESFDETHWIKKEDELTLKSIETYYYTTTEINKIVEVINKNIDAQIVKMDDEIRAYVKEEYTLQTTTTELTEKVNANGESIEQIYGENTTEIPTLNLAQLSILADGINSEVLKKVGNDEIISKINQSAEAVKILAKLIQFEGLVTANENFKILEDGSIEAVNGSFKGNIYLSNGSQIVGGNGLLTNFQFQGVNNKGSSDFGFLGFDSAVSVDSDIIENPKNKIVFNVHIPEDFIVLDARLFLVHAPVRFGYYDTSDNEHHEWGYSRNIRLYKETLDNYYINTWLGSSYDYEEVTTDTEIVGALGTNGFTASVPSDSSHKLENLKSGNFKSYLTTGVNRFSIKTADDAPTEEYGYYGTDYGAAKRTGRVQAFIEVIGYLNYKGE